jgi:hypothetical protein
VRIRRLLQGNEESVRHIDKEGLATSRAGATRETQKGTQWFSSSAKLPLHLHAGFHANSRIRDGIPAELTVPDYPDYTAVCTVQSPRNKNKRAQQLFNQPHVAASKTASNGVSTE